MSLFLPLFDLCLPIDTDRQDPEVHTADGPYYPDDWQSQVARNNPCIGRYAANQLPSNLAGRLLRSDARSIAD